MQVFSFCLTTGIMFTLLLLDTWMSSPDQELTSGGGNEQASGEGREITISQLLATEQWLDGQLLEYETALDAGIKKEKTTKKSAHVIISFIKMVCLGEDNGVFNVMSNSFLCKSKLLKLLNIPIHAFSDLCVKLCSEHNILLPHLCKW